MKHFSLDRSPPWWQCPHLHHGLLTDLTALTVSGYQPNGWKFSQENSFLFLFGLFQLTGKLEMASRHLQTFKNASFLSPANCQFSVTSMHTIHFTIILIRSRIHVVFSWTHQNSNSTSHPYRSAFHTFPKTRLVKCLYGLCSECPSNECCHNNITCGGSLVGHFIIFFLSLVTCVIRKYSQLHAFFWLDDATLLPLCYKLR